MAEVEVISPPPVPTPAAEGESIAGRDHSPTERRDGKPDRPRRDDDIPDMTVEEASKALNALPKVCICLDVRSTGLKVDPTFVWFDRVVALRRRPR